MDPVQLKVKKERLAAGLGAFDSLAVAFSGGADSALLAAVAREILGTQMVALKAVSALHSQREHKAALAFAERFDIPLIVVPTEELKVPGLAANPTNRCYLCKRYLMACLKEQARKQGFSRVAHGANVDDLDDYRPGFRAAEELDIAAPLMDAGFTKAEVRALSRQMGLPTWDRPSMACLASRFPYGTPLLPHVLAMVEQAEEVLYALGVPACRVRHHGKVARIEADQAQMAALVKSSVRERVVAKLRAIGYDHVCVDLEGYVQGSLNRELGEAGTS